MAQFLGARPKPTPEEIENAKWWVKTIGGNIYHNPSVKPPIYNVRTADYYVDSKKAYLEHKGPIEDGKNTIANAIAKGEGQATNILVDITNSSRLFKDGLLDVIGIFDNTRFAWVDLIILRKGDEFNVIELL